MNGRPETSGKTPIMKKLTIGTPKQIAWATRIREDMAASARAVIADPASGELLRRKAKASLRNLESCVDATLLIDIHRDMIPYGSPYRGIDRRFLTTRAEAERIDREIDDDREKAEGEVLVTPDIPTDGRLPIVPGRGRRRTPDDGERRARAERDGRIRDITRRLGDQRETGR